MVKEVFSPAIMKGFPNIFRERLIRIINIDLEDFLAFFIHTYPLGNGINKEALKSIISEREETMYYRRPFWGLIKL